MKVYLVGGAVRDEIMGHTPIDRDYVVVGSTPEEMIKRGFSQVGADFPVFLDTDGTEYALARTEYKDGNGYKGFKVAFGPDVTLIDDLYRRDLTINAIAKDMDTGEIIDPFHGREDIENGILRATSSAFVDDPLRVFRLARFAARYPDFRIDTSTIGIAKTVTASEDFKTLSPERVGIEVVKTLTNRYGKSSRFFRVLKEIGGLEFYFPEIHALIGQTQPEQWHPEGDSFEHTMLVLDQSEGYGYSVKIAALGHDFGKGLTPKDKLPHHYGHEAAGVKPVGAMIDRLSLGNNIKAVSQYVAKFHMHVHKAEVLNPKTYVNVFEQTPRHDPMYFVKTLTIVAGCDARGRGPESTKDRYPEGDIFFNIMNAISTIKVRDIMTQEEIDSSSVDKIKQRFRSARIAAASKAIKEQKEVTRT